MAVAQDGAGHCLLFTLEHPRPLDDLFGWPALGCGSPDYPSGGTLSG
ncbi:hypothetical protein [Aeromonas jandaei]